MPFDTRMNTYNALVMPYFNYCSTVWGNIGIGLADIKSKNYKTWLPETSPFLITRYAQMCYWMSLTGKDLKFLGRNNLLCVCTTCIIIFPYHTSTPLIPETNRYQHSKNVHAYNLGNSKINFHIPRRDLEQNLKKRACSIKDLFCGIEFPQF